MRATPSGLRVQRVSCQSDEESATLRFSEKNKPDVNSARRENSTCEHHARPGNAILITVAESVIRRVIYSRTWRRSHSLHLEQFRFISEFTLVTF